LPKFGSGEFFGELCEMRRMYGVAYIVQQKTGLGGKFIGERLRVIIGIRNGCGLSLRANKIERGGFAHARRADEHGAGMLAQGIVEMGDFAGREIADARDDI